jgi:hypothetical protein
VVKPYHTSETQDNNSQEPKERNDTEEPLRRNPERNRQSPTRLEQNFADISVFLGNCQDTKALPTYAESRQKEINGLFDKRAFEFIDASEVPEGARIFGSRFVDEIKHLGTDKAYEKSRLVIYNDPEKDLILTQSPTVQRVSQRLILALATTLKDDKKKPLTLYLRDISQAYV